MMTTAAVLCVSCSAARVMVAKMNVEFSAPDGVPEQSALVVHTRYLYLYKITQVASNSPLRTWCLRSSRGDKIHLLYTKKCISTYVGNTFTSNFLNTAAATYSHNSINFTSTDWSKSLQSEMVKKSDHLIPTTATSRRFVE